MNQTRARNTRERGNRGSITRAARYLWRYKGQAMLPYFFLLAATAAQLAVPRLVANIINAVTNGVIARTVLEALPKIPGPFLSQALPAILNFLKYPASWDQNQLVSKLTSRIVAMSFCEPRSWTRVLSS